MDGNAWFRAKIGGSHAPPNWTVDKYVFHANILSITRRTFFKRQMAQNLLVLKILTTLLKIDQRDSEVHRHTNLSES